MENQVLTIEQMNVLTNLGIDVSKASCEWSHRPYYGWKFHQKGAGTDSDEEYIPTFTLQDILKMLPRGWEIGTYVANRNTLTVFLNELGYCHQEVSDSLLEAAFNMLKWCKENGYI